MNWIAELEAPTLLRPRQTKETDHDRRRTTSSKARLSREPDADDTAIETLITLNDKCTEPQNASCCSNCVSDFGEHIHRAEASKR
jgi:hypothetical protein